MTPARASAAVPPNGELQGTRPAQAMEPPLDSVSGRLRSSIPFLVLLGGDTIDAVPRPLVTVERVGGFTLDLVARSG
jgi:hypothetical protein